MAQTPQQELEEQLLTRGDRVLVVVGAGVSIAATNGAECASWEGLLKDGIDYCRTHCLHLPDQWAKVRQDELGLKEYIPVATAITAALAHQHEGAYSRWLAASIGKRKATDNRSIQAIADWHVQVATTNYDTLIEQATSCATITWNATPQVLQFLRGDLKGHFVWHIHGAWDEPDSVILGARSYDDIIRDTSTRDLLRALLMIRTLVFVGCGDGLADPNFTALFTWSREALRTCQHSHFVLAASRHAHELSAQYAGLPIQVVPYGKAYSDLPEFLERLADALRRQRESPPDRVQMLIRGQSDFEGRLRELDTLRPSLLPGEYVRQLAALSEELWQAGGLRRAWWSFAGHFEREAINLERDERVRLGIRLVEMILEDDNAESAVGILEQIRSDLEMLPTDARRNAHYRRLEVRCYNDLCAYTEALAAIACALASATDPEERAHWEAQSAEIQFLQGDGFESNDLAGEEQQP